VCIVGFPLPCRLLPLLALSLLGCDSTGPSRTHATFATLFASAFFQDQVTGARSGCTLSGVLSVRRWPASAGADTASLHLTRQYSPDDSTSVLRDTGLSGIPVSLTGVDSLHVVIGLGAPLDQTIAGTLDSVGGWSMSGTWTCPSAPPLAADSALLAQGYAADSLPPGALHLDRHTPID